MSKVYVLQQDDEDEGTQPVFAVLGSFERALQYAHEYAEEMYGEEEDFDVSELSEGEVAELRESIKEYGECEWTTPGVDFLNWIVTERTLVV